MKTYTTKTAITLTTGVLQLSAKQAADRAACLKELEDGTHEVIGPIHFKAGETFGHDLDLPKAIAQCVEEDESLGEDEANGQEAEPKPVRKPKSVRKPKA